MSGFDAKEGLIHFLFAEPDDYYLESLLKLDLMQFLYYSIKSQEYDGIYFLKQENTVKTFLGSKEEISVYCLDQKSVDEFPAETGYLGDQVAGQTRTGKIQNVRDPGQERNHDIPDTDDDKKGSELCVCDASEYDEKPASYRDIPGYSSE